MLSRKVSKSSKDLTVQGIAYKTIGGLPQHIPAANYNKMKQREFSTIRKTSSIGNLRGSVQPMGARDCCVHKNHSCGHDTCGSLNALDYEQHKIMEQYCRNLQQQIYFLEIENNYLRQLSTDSSRKEKTAAAEPSNKSQLRSTPSNAKTTDTLIESPSRSPHIQHPSKDSISLKSRQNLQSTSLERNTQSSPVRPTKSTEKLDEFRSHMVVTQAEMLIKLEDAYQRELRVEEKLTEKIDELHALEEENARLSRELRKAENGFGRVEDSHSRDKRALMEEIVELQRRLDDLTPALANKESHIAKLENEKDSLASRLRATTNSLNSLQMKLDEKKREESMQSRIHAERRDELDRLTRNVRSLEMQLAEQRERETRLMEDVAAAKRAQREEELRAKKEGAVSAKVIEENNALINENSRLSAQISRLEMNLEKMSAEGSARRVNERNIAEIAELKETENELNTQLSRMQDKLRSEQERIRLMETEIEECHQMEQNGREARQRMEKELKALQALSESLSNENKTLRQEKIGLNERCEELQRKVNSLTKELSMKTGESNELSERCQFLQQKADETEKESASLRLQVKTLTEKNSDQQTALSEAQNDLKLYKERYEALAQDYKDLIAQREREFTIQNERSSEYEQLVDKVRELSASISRRSATSSPSISRNNYHSSTRQESHTDSRSSTVT